MLKFFKYKSVFAISVLIIVLFLSAGISFADINNDKIVSDDLSSIGEIASEHSISSIASKAAQNYNSKKSSDKMYSMPVEDIGYGEAKVLKPILISYYANSLSKYKNMHKVMSSRSGKPMHLQKVTVDIAPIIEKYAEKYNVDPYLIKAIIKTESGFRPYAVSYCGAAGLMQLMPGTAGALGVKNIFDPEQNIEAGTKYIKGLIDRMKNLTFAIAAYNAGPYNVLKHGGIPPFTETRNFVNRVLKYYNER